MPGEKTAARCYRFGEHEVDAVKRLLFHHGNRVSLTPKAFDLLLLLVQRHGQIVNKDELIREIWPDAVVEETSLTRNISVLRKLLGETPDDHMYIVTVPGTGYRFVAAVEEISAPAELEVGRTSARGSSSAAAVRVQEVTRPATRIIVLPFRILRPDPETEFLAFSLPDAITTSLSSLHSVIVRSSRTASQLTEKLTELKTIAKRAQVDAIVTGTLLRVGDQIRVSTELCEAASTTVLWSSAAQWSLSDIFQLQDEIVRRVIESLSLRLTQREQQLLRHDVPATARAYEYYLRANQLSLRRDQLKVACDLYAECIAEDPGYAPAWARMGRCHRVLGKYGHDPEQNLQRAEQAFLRALELNPDLSLAHNLYAHLEAERGRAQDAMLRLLDRVRTYSNDAELFAGLVYVCRYCGLLNASAGAYARARYLDPNISTTGGHTFLMMGQFERALETAAEDTWFVDSLALAGLGRSREAVARLRRIEHQQLLPLVRAVLTSVRALLESNTEEAVTATRAFAERLVDPEASYYAARQFAYLGEKRDALRLLNEAVERGFFSYPTLLSDPWLDPLRSDPDFALILTSAKQKHERASAAFDACGGNLLVGGGSLQRR
jgi:DNA-binding winged helix-turn-helix (wHTH) protein/tetratricopeptide (TPR) repeat protein